MTSTDTAQPRSGAHERRTQYARWARLLDTILPPPDADRLVSVAEVGRAGLPFLESSLADAGLAAVVSPARGRDGDERFRVLVPARDAELAEEVVAGC